MFCALFYCFPLWVYVLYNPVLTSVIILGNFKFSVKELDIEIHFCFQCFKNP